MGWKFWEKELFELVDTEAKTVVETIDGVVAKDDILLRVEMGDLEDVGYSLRGVKGNKSRIVWSIRKKKPKDKAETVKKMTKDEAMQVLKAKAERLKEETEEFEELKETVVNTFSPGGADLEIMSTPMEGLKKGLGTALFKGLTKHPEDTVDRVFGSVDAATMLMKGAAALCMKKAGVPIGKEIQQKETKKDDGSTEIELGVKDGEEDEEKNV